MATLPRRTLPRRTLPRLLGQVLLVVACAMVLTAPNTAATTSPNDGYRPAIMRMEYAVGDLTAEVHAPRTLVDTRPLVFNFRGYDDLAQEKARQGFIVVLVSNRLSLDRHAALWRELDAGTGPLAERFRGFAGHFSVAER